MLATASNHEHEETKNGGAAGNSEPQKPSKKGKKRVVPGSLLMESISAAGLPEAGRELLSKQVYCRAGMRAACGYVKRTSCVRMEADNICLARLTRCLEY